MVHMYPESYIHHEIPPFCRSAILSFTVLPFHNSTSPPFLHSSIPPIHHSVIPPFRKSIQISRNDHNVLYYLSYQHTDVHCEVQRSAPSRSPEEQNCASSASRTDYIWIALKCDGIIWRTFQCYECSRGCRWRKYDKHGVHGKK